MENQKTKTTHQLRDEAIKEVVNKTGLDYNQARNVEKALWNTFIQRDAVGNLTNR
jgi:hypothetical protein